MGPTEGLLGVGVKRTTIIAEVQQVAVALPPPHVYAIFADGPRWLSGVMKRVPSLRARSAD